MMGKCEFLETCGLYAIEVIASNVELKKRFQETFCSCDSSKCARHYVRKALGKGLVPELMLPHQIEWAKQLVSDNRILVVK
jgi:hypothetical protein